MTGEKSTLLPYPKGLGRELLRSPLLLYRMGLGRLLDPFHVMILTTRGRLSGQPRFTPIEYRRHGSRYYVISVWGELPQWVRNLQKDPVVTLTQGSQTFKARAEIVHNDAEALLVLHLFRRPNPFIYDAILARVGNVEALDIRKLPDLTSEYTIVRFNLEQEPPTLPEPSHDLRWLLPAGVTALLALIVVLARRATSERNADS
ncbi:MAG: nitroreductase family deazaflavin-dependent oxidoreductase [Anaerolineae bacterium]|nr:nitroreductase family deazaflavin-dependent oxidoreductase [Anaerolineae bacterium]